MKNTLIMEAETKCRYKVYYQRHRITASGRRHREMGFFVKIEARKGCTPREKGCEHPPSEECSKEAVKSLM